MCKNQGVEILRSSGVKFHASQSAHLQQTLPLSDPNSEEFGFFLGVEATATPQSGDLP